MCTNNNNNNEHKLIITIEPKQNFHFRYVNELRSTSHGFLTGQQSTEQSNDVGVGVYPTVKLLLPENEPLLNEFNKKREFYVLCTLHNFDNKCLSTHVLKPKETDFSYELIFQKMDDNHSNTMEKFWKLQEYVIVRVTKAVYKTALESKRDHFEALNLQMSFEAIKGNINFNDNESLIKSAGLNVCLGFTVFEKVNDTFRLFNETIYSNNIHNGDDLKIHKLCNEDDSGGEKITILINLNSKLPLNVLIAKVNDITERTEWSQEIKIKEKDIFGNHAITFTLPPYGGPSCSGAKILVSMQVVVRDTTYKSDAKEFYYLNRNLRRRKTPQSSQSSPAPQEESAELTVVSSPILANTEENYPISPTLDYDPSFNDFLDDLAQNEFDNDDFNNVIEELNNYLFPNPNLNPNVSKDRMLPSHHKQAVSKSDQSENPFYTLRNKIDQILQMSDDKQDIDIRGLETKDDNTIFHEALAMSCMYLFKMAKLSPHKKLILEARNKFQENLLHYSCKHNRSTCIRPLIGMGCRLYEQDTEGRTPLHTAMEYQHNDCILKIQQLLKDHSEYPKEVEENLIKMFKVHNHKGFTVLHAAVIGNRVELLQIMLEFCRKCNIDVKDYEVLGNGVSLKHLIYLKHNLIAVITVIRRTIPCYFKVENYFLKLMPLCWHWLYQIHQRKC